MAVLDKKSEITRFQILVEVAASQPQIKQSQIASTLGITPQAVSEYIKDLAASGMITSSGRGQYAVTPLGVESIINGARELREYSDHVLKDVVGQVSVWAAIAGGPIKKDSIVYITMEEGFLYANASGMDGAKGIAINDAAPGEDVGVANLSGLIPLRKESVTVIRIPTIVDGGSHAVDKDRLRKPQKGIVCVMGIEALATARAADIKPDVTFGALEAAAEAAIKGVRSTLIVSMDMAPQAIQKLETNGIEYTVIDAGDSRK